MEGINVPNYELLKCLYRIPLFQSQRPFGDSFHRYSVYERINRFSRNRNSVEIDQVVTAGGSVNLF